MGKAPDVSVIIVSYNTKKLLFDCLRTVFASEKVSFEVFVVDNASKDGSAKIVKKQFPNVHLIQNTENRGFAAANNQGIKQANGRYVLLLNSDTEVEKDTLQKMVSFMDQQKDVEIASCQQVEPSGAIQPSAGYAPTWWRVVAWMFFLDDLPLVRSLLPAYHKLGPLFFQTKQAVDWVQGSFLFFRQELGQKIGLLDEEIFLYGEDVEWCWRARRNGYTVLYTPITKILHHGHSSSRAHHEPGLLGELRAMQYMYKKFYGPVSAMLVTMILWTGSALRWAIFGIIRARKDARTAYAAFCTGRSMG